MTSAGHPVLMRIPRKPWPPPRRPAGLTPSRRARPASGPGPADRPPAPVGGGLAPVPGRVGRRGVVHRARAGFVVSKYRFDVWQSQEFLRALADWDIDGLVG